MFLPHDAAPGLVSLIQGGRFWTCLPRWFHSFRQVKITLDDGGVRTLGEVRFVLELRKNLISLGTL